MMQAKLKAILAERQTTMYDFANTLGMKPDTFYKKMSGKSEFTFPEAVRICKALEIENPRDVLI